MTTLVYVIAYIGIVFFLIAVAARFVFWSKMPMHLRWELYPVAHEGGGRAAYGGSYLEESDWWKKKREVSLLGELKVMVPEILFLVALREHNRKLWTWSFPFHFGLYLVAATTMAPCCPRTRPRRSTPSSVLWPPGSEEPVWSSGSSARSGFSHADADVP
jgi:nitrate reductase gamma subunit